MFEGKNKFQNKLRQSRMGKIIDRLKKKWTENKGTIEQNKSK